MRRYMNIHDMHTSHDTYSSTSYAYHTSFAFSTLPLVLVPDVCSIHDTTALLLVPPSPEPFDKPAVILGARRGLNRHLPCTCNLQASLLPCTPTWLRAQISNHRERPEFYEKDGDRMHSDYYGIVSEWNT